MEKTVNQRLVLLRSQLGFTQNEMSDMIGVSYPTYRRLEKEDGFPTKYINLIIDKFNLNRDWFINGVGEMGEINNTKSNKESSWRDTAFEAVIAERDNLREMVNQLIMRIPIAAQKSFKLPSVEWGGSMNCNTGVRA